MFTTLLHDASSQTVMASFGSKDLTIEVVDSPKQRTRGLGGRLSLADNSGMLFVMDQVGYHSIWMKDMNFAIDIIWLDEDREVVDIYKAASPESYPKSFLPRQPTKYVIEVNSDWTERNSIYIGQQVELSNI